MDLTITLRHLLGRVDRYSTYTGPKQLAGKRSAERGHFTGIGVQIRKEAATGLLCVVTPIKGSPGYRAGLQAGDHITTLTREVDSEGNALNPPEVLSTGNLTLSEAIARIVGKAGTKIKLTVQREGVAKPFVIEVSRALIDVETVVGVRRKAQCSLAGSLPAGAAHPEPPSLLTANLAPAAGSPLGCTAVRRPPKRTPRNGRMVREAVERHSRDQDYPGHRLLPVGAET